MGVGPPSTGIGANSATSDDAQVGKDRIRDNVKLSEVEHDRSDEDVKDEDPVMETTSSHDREKFGYSIGVLSGSFFEDVAGSYVRAQKDPEVSGCSSEANSTRGPE